jgi:hypothetical protein
MPNQFYIPQHSRNRWLIKSFFYNIVCMHTIFIITNFPRRKYITLKMSIPWP